MPDLGVDRPEGPASEGLGQTVLIVTSREMEARLLSGMLSALHYRGTIAVSSVDAGRELAARRFNAILLDMDAESIDSTAVAQCIGRQVGHAPVIGLTDDPSAKKTENGIAAGMIAVLERPCSLPTLVATLVHAITSTGAVSS